MSTLLPRIAWIGLGIMGSPMAENLIKAGYAVTG
jgi:2-hydroxy-3-oxopropionate reductase